MHIFGGGGLCFDVVGSLGGVGLGNLGGGRMVGLMALWWCWQVDEW